MNDSDQRDRARAVLAENPTRWYHTLELAPGIVTPGYIDMRTAAPRVIARRPLRHESARHRHV